MPQAIRKTAAARRLPASGMESRRSRTMPAVPASATGTSGACQTLLNTVKRGAATLRVGDGRTTVGATDIAVLGRPSHSVAKPLLRPTPLSPVLRGEGSGVRGGAPARGLPPPPAPSPPAYPGSGGD